MCVYFVHRESEGFTIIFMATVSVSHSHALINKGTTCGFLLVGTVWQQKLLSDKNGNFLQFEQEAPVQYESFFLAFQWM